MQTLNIIFVSYNGAQDTINCINSLINGNTNYFNLQIIIVDNNSNDVEQLQEYITKEKFANFIHLIKNAKNLGFAAANNIGINYLKENNAFNGYLWFLNNDTLISSNLLELMSLNLPNENEVEYFEMHDFEDKYFNNGLNYISLTTGKYSETPKNNYVPYICGASIFLKCSEKVPMWNEIFFLYYEDVDFSFQLKHRGFNFRQINNSNYKHKISASSKQKTGINLIKAESQKKFMKLYGKNYLIYCFLKLFYLLLKFRFAEIKILFK